MKILFDKGSSQVQVDLEDGGKRLATLYAAIEAQGWTHAVGPDRISSDALTGVDCLAILTRHGYGSPSPFPKGWNFAFTDDELQAIAGFVQDGGGVVLISNHGPFAKGDVDWTVNDKVLAAKFGVTINAAAYQMPASGGSRPPLTMSGSELNSAQTCILDGVTSIVPHNSCAVSTSDASAFIASIPSDAVNPSPIYPNGPAGQNYAVVAGQVIVAGNSGIAGSAGTPHPAPGMIDEGSNKQFLLNCFRCVGRKATS